MKRLSNCNLSVIELLLTFLIICVIIKTESKTEISNRVSLQSDSKSSSVVAHPYRGAWIEIKSSLCCPPNLLEGSCKCESVLFSDVPHSFGFDRYPLAFFIDELFWVSGWRKNLYPVAGILGENHY